jgi:hypothetical protein
MFRKKVPGTDEIEPWNCRITTAETLDNPQQPGVKLEHMSEKWIKASEISGYVYCRRAWWLERVRGFASQNRPQLEAGRRYHQQHGRLVERSALARWLAYGLLFFVVAFITFQLLMSLGI